jgi:hypothetical protein
VVIGETVMWDGSKRMVGATVAVDTSLSTVSSHEAHN